MRTDLSLPAREATSRRLPRASKYRYRDWPWVLLFLGPNFVLFVAFLAFPVAYGLYISFFKWNIIETPTFIGFANYWRFFTDPLTPKLATQAIIVPTVAHGAFGTFLFRQFFMRIPDEYYEAAKLDGANYWQQFWRLTLPLSRPVLSAYGIITFLNAWKFYLWPLIVVRSPQMKVVPMAIAELSGTAGENRAVMMAAVALSILPLFILWLVAQK
jgi:ABC-type glycerol-3-phosphate transport system permease component